MTSQLRLPISADWKTTLEAWAAELRSTKFITDKDMGEWKAWEPVISGTSGMVVSNQRTRIASYCKMLHLCRIELDCIVDYSSVATGLVSISNLPIVPSFKSLLPISTFLYPQIQVGEVRLTVTAGEAIGRAYLRPDTDLIQIIKNDGSNFDLIADGRISFSGFYPIDNNLAGAV